MVREARAARPARPEETASQAAVATISQRVASNASWLKYSIP